MAKVRRTGAGALVEVFTASDYESVGATIDITPPAQVRAEIDVTAQQDTVAQAEPGIEELSHFAFNEVWDGVSVTMLDTLYAAKSKVNWRVTFQGTPTKTIVFEGWVSKLEPSTVGKGDAVLRNVTVTRTGAITIS